jgi:hypothetical protein
MDPRFGARGTSAASGWHDDAPVEVQEDAMNDQKWILRLVATFVFTAACSKEAPKGADDMVVQGTVDQQLRTNAVEAVAVGTDGRSFWSALDARGDFRLVIPSGQSYRIVLASRGANGQPLTVAYLALTATTGKTQWVSGRSGATLRLGNLLPASQMTTSTAGGVTPQSDGTSDLSSADSTGSGRGGSGRGGVDDTGSGRGGSGRGGADDSGSGRGGAGGSDDSMDDFDDDSAHADDPPCHEGGADDSMVCPSSATVEMASSRNDAEDVSDCGDFKNQDQDTASCTAAPPAGGSSPPAGGADTTTASGGVPSSTGAVAGSGGAAAGGSPPVDTTPAGSPGVN